MKKSIWLFALIILSVMVLTGACSSNSNNPAGPPKTNATATSTPTITCTATPTAQLAWYYAWVKEEHNVFVSSPVTDACIGMQANGQPCSIAAVTVSGGGQTFALPFTQTYADYGVTFGIYRTSSFTYTAGATYFFSTAALGVTATSSVVAPGPNPSFTYDSTNGAITQAGWNFNPSAGGAVMENSAGNSVLWTQIFPAGALSVDIPDSGVSNAYPNAAPCTYVLWIDLANANHVITHGIDGSGNGLQAENYYSIAVTTH